MTSTGFNIGLSSEKNSSRVLRPPGGGHTDIFGVNQNEIVTPSKRRNHPQSTISSCFSMVDEPKHNIETNENGNSKQEEVTNEEEKNEVDNITDENKAPGEDEKEKQETVTVPKRGRVPPGGFSSGLW